MTMVNGPIYIFYFVGIVKFAAKSYIGHYFSTITFTVFNTICHPFFFIFKAVCLITPFWLQTTITCTFTYLDCIDVYNN